MDRDRFPLPDVLPPQPPFRALRASGISAVSMPRRAGKDWVAANGDARRETNPVYTGRSMLSRTFSATGKTLTIPWPIDRFLRK
jgi:hypothetical protein